VPWTAPWQAAGSWERGRAAEEPSPPGAGGAARARPRGGANGSNGAGAALGANGSNGAGAALGAAAPEQGDEVAPKPTPLPPPVLIGHAASLTPY
jgi:hypothetical protein